MTVRGLQHALNTMQRQHADAEEGFNPNKPLFYDLYKTCVRPSRKGRESFLSQLMRVCEISAAEAERRGRTERPLQRLAVLVLAHLPFECQDEPLHVVWRINRLLSLESRYAVRPGLARCAHARATH